MANKTIKFGSVFGNFKWEAEAEVNESLQNALLPLGALQVAQRSPSTAAEKAIAGYDKRPKGFQRTSIPFSDAAAKTLAEHLENMEVVLGEGEDAEKVAFPCVVTVSEYEGGGTAESKFTAERAKYASKQGDAKALAKLASAVGYDGDLGDGTAENAPMEFLVAIRKWVRAQADAL